MRKQTKKMMIKRLERGGEKNTENMAHARRLGRSAARDPHPHRICGCICIYASRPLRWLLVHGHMYAIRDNTKQSARRALHRKRIPLSLLYLYLKQGKRVTPVHA
jgi:hypothetical protein